MATVVPDGEVDEVDLELPLVGVDDVVTVAVAGATEPAGLAELGFTVAVEVSASTEQESMG